MCANPKRLLLMPANLLALVFTDPLPPVVLGTPALTCAAASDAHASATSPSRRSWSRWLKVFQPPAGAGTRAAAAAAATCTRRVFNACTVLLARPLACLHVLRGRFDPQARVAQVTL